MPESAKILIEAEDKASRVANLAARGVEQNLKNIKDVGQKTKASTEFLGVIATFSGGSQIGSLASQLAALTEKTSQFAEVSKLGGAGALAFKTGLAGLAGVISFQVGRAIGDVVFQTEKWNRLLEESRVRSDALANKQKEVAERIFQRRKAEANSAENDDAARQSLLRSVNSELGSQEKRMRTLESDSKLLTANFMKDSTDLRIKAVGYLTAWWLSSQQKIAQQDAEQQRSLVEQTTKHRNELEQSDIQRQLSVDALVKSENERLDVMAKELRYGREAARVLELQQKDVDEATAKQLARREEMLRPRDQLQGLESRLLTRGPTNRPEDKIVEELKKLPKSIGEEIANKKHNEPPPQKLELEIVGM